MTASTPVSAQPLDAVLADLRSLDDLDLVASLRDVCMVIRSLQAQQAAVMSELESRLEAMGYPLSGAADTIAVTLAISARSAEHLLGDATGICDREQVWLALAEGLIDLPKAARIVEELAEIPDPRRAELELVAIGYAQHHTSHQLRHRLLAMTCADPDERQRQAAIDARGVSAFARGHGMADIHAHVPAEQAEAFMQALDALAAAQDCPDPYEQGDERTLTQRRADALGGFLGAHCRFDVHVDVVISADALLGVENAGAELNGSPATTALARSLAWSQDARWTRLVTDPLTGTLLDVSAETYRLPAPIRRAVIARDATCRFPGCHHRAVRADADHTVAWPIGETSPANLAMLCRRHHRIKTFSAWKVHCGLNGDLHWTSPLATAHTTKPWNYHRRD